MVDECEEFVVGIVLTDDFADLFFSDLFVLDSEVIMSFQDGFHLLVVRLLNIGTNSFSNKS